MRESRTYGSVRGAPSNGRPYRDRAKYDRSGLRYASDVTDAEWALIAPHLPGEKPLGRRRETDLREVVNALLYMATTGCQWRMLPKDFPPYSTVQDYFYPWSRDAKLQIELAGHGTWTIEVVKRPTGVQGLEVLPRRWVVERTFAWLGRCRRLAKDVEATVTSAVAWVLIAHIRLLSRRLARA